MDVAGEQDAIVVCTNAGCVDVIVGEVVRVKDGNSLPSRTSERSNVPPLVARQDIFVPENPADIKLIPLPLAEGVLPGVSAMFAFGNARNDDSLRGGEDPSTGVGTFVGGQLVKHEVANYGGGSVIVQKTSTGAGSFGQVGNTTDLGFIGWGYWDAGTIRSTSGQVQPTFFSESEESAGVHYIVGRPTPQLDMPREGTAVYSPFRAAGGFLSGTAPTATSYDGKSIFGTLLGAGLNVDFLRGRLTGYVNTQFVKDGQVVPVNIYDYGYVDGSTFYANGCSRGGYFSGFFTGLQASRAGMLYEIDDNLVGHVQGAVVLLKNGSTTQVSGMQALFASRNNNFFGYSPSNWSNPSSGIATFVGNQMYMHDDGEDSGGYGGTSYLFAAASPVTSSGSLGNPTDSDFIGWGYWAKGNKLSSYSGNSSLTGVHYLVGRPTLPSQMPLDGGTATYSMVGNSGTAPTATLNGVTSLGRLDRAQLDVNFGSGSVRAEVDTTFVKNGSNVPVQLRESGNIFNYSSFYAGSSAGSVRGFFVGDQATRAGMIYQQDTSQSSNSLPPANIGIVQGAVALARGAITPAVVLNTAGRRAP